MALLETVRLTKKFGGLTAVDSVDLEIHEGEILGLIGPNGAGKTTIFNVINGFYRPSAGYIFFRGEKIDGLKPNAICKKGIGRTFQVVKPLARLSVLENVMASTFLHTSSVAEARRRAQELLDFVGLASQRDVIARNLTLGGRKRLEMARGLGTQPRLLLLDEVVAGLNPTETSQVIETIRKTREKGITILIIEHVMQVIMNISDRVVVLHHGKKIAEGKPAEVARNRTVIEAYLGEVGDAYA